MKIKVGDTVRIVKNTFCSENKVGDVGTVVDAIGSDYRVQVEGPTISNWSHGNDLELVAHTTISAAIRERMEHHMSKGEYVRAVKWAELAEQAEEIENDA